MRKRRRSGSASDIVETLSSQSSGQQNQHMTNGLLFLLVFLLLMISYSSYRAAYLSTTVNGYVVWWYAWLTAICTGIGALPFIYVNGVDKIYLGLSNGKLASGMSTIEKIFKLSVGFAAGMMLAASLCLVYEGYNCRDDFESQLNASSRTGFGFFIGIAFILYSKMVLDQYEEMKFGALDGLNAKKAILIMGVMTLHSFSEGVRTN